MAIFQRLNREQGLTVIFVTHEPDIAYHTRRIIHLRDGLIVSRRAGRRTRESAQRGARQSGETVSRHDRGRIRVALRALGANKLRTTLTMLGIIIGVAAVIALMSIGRGAQAQVTSQIQSLGTNLLFIRPGVDPDQGGVRSAPGSAPTLTLDDADAIALLPNVVAAAPELGTVRPDARQRPELSTRASPASTEDYADVRNSTVADGDFISQPAGRRPLERRRARRHAWPSSCSPMPTRSARRCA